MMLIMLFGSRLGGTYNFFSQSCYFSKKFFIGIDLMNLLFLGNALRDDYHFVPIAVETFGSWGPIGHKFITDIGRTIAGITKNPKSTSFIFQAISMAVQRGNVQCVQGAYGELAFEELDKIF